MTETVLWFVDYSADFNTRLLTLTAQNWTIFCSIFHSKALPINSKEKYVRNLWPIWLVDSTLFDFEPRKCWPDFGYLVHKWIHWLALSVVLFGGYEKKPCRFSSVDSSIWRVSPFLYLSAVRWISEILQKVFETKFLDKLFENLYFNHYFKDKLARYFRLIPPPLI